MNTAYLSIPYVAGSIFIEYSFWKGLKFTVNGQPIKPHGFPRNRLTLPGVQGPIEAKVKGGFLQAHPSLVVGDQEYTTGPPTPPLQQVLALLPLLLLIFVQGGIGFGVAFGAVAVNMGIIRGERSNAIKAALMVGTLVVAGAILASSVVIIANVF